MFRLYTFRIAAVAAAIALVTSSLAAQPSRISAELKTTQVTVTNGVADATFKVVVHNEEAVALANTWLVFEDGFEVSVGDIAAESSAESESTTRTFDLSQQMQSLAVPFAATLKFAVDGNTFERSTSITLHLQPE